MTKIVFPSNFHILLVDDDLTTLSSWEMLLRMGGVRNIITCPKSENAMDILAAKEIGSVVLDINMPNLSGDKLLAMIVKEYPELPVIMSTGINEVEMAVQCMRVGAFDYLTKPVEEGRLLSSLKRALDFWELQQENSNLTKSLLSDELAHPDVFTDILTMSPKMFSIFRYLEATSKSSKPITLYGETGTGKELIAHATHSLSRPSGEFVAVNVGGLDDTMFSDTLFGHSSGAFTGANTKRDGQINRAEKGTLFLDEIGDLNPTSQVKLLRLLQDREYYPLGSDTVKTTNARIVLATNQNLESLVADGRFRKDLFYRLQSHPIVVPPLRKRLEDLPLLVGHFLERAADDLEKVMPTYPKELIILLSTYSFPGNIRELEAMIFDALSQHTSGILSMRVFKEKMGLTQNPHLHQSNSDSEIGSAILFRSLEHSPSLYEAAQMAIEEAMHRAKGNQSVASKLLGITQPSLSRRLKQTKG